MSRLNLLLALAALLLCLLSCASSTTAKLHSTGTSTQRDDAAMLQELEAFLEEMDAEEDEETFAADDDDDNDDLLDLLLEDENQVLDFGEYEKQQHATNTFVLIPFLLFLLQSQLKSLTRKSSLCPTASALSTTFSRTSTLSRTSSSPALCEKLRSATGPMLTPTRFPASTMPT